MDSYAPFHTSIPPVLYAYCECSTHDACTCPCNDYVDATCANLEMRMNEWTEKVVETMKVRITEYSH